MTKKYSSSTQTFLSLLKKQNENRPPCKLKRTKSVYYVTFTCLLCNKEYISCMLNNNGVTICSQCED